MLANTITLTRLILTFGVIALLGIHRTLDIAIRAGCVVCTILGDRRTAVGTGLRGTEPAR